MASSIIPKALNGDISSLNDALSNCATKTDLANCVKVVEGYEVATTAGTNSYVVGCTAPTGYTRVANIGVVTSGFVSAATFDTFATNPRVFFKSGEVANGWVKLIALYVKTS